MTAVRPDDTAGTGERLMRLIEYIACENDEGYGCDCHPGSKQAYADLDALVAAVREAEARAERAEQNEASVRRELLATTASWREAFQDNIDSRTVARELAAQANDERDEAVARAERLERGRVEDGAAIEALRAGRDGDLRNDALVEALRLADEQLMLEGEKHPNHNISKVRQAIAAAVSGEALNEPFCGERLAPTGPPCVMPRGHRGLHVPVTHQDVGEAVRDAWLGEAPNDE